MTGVLYYLLSDGKNCLKVCKSNRFAWTNCVKQVYIQYYYMYVLYRVLQTDELIVIALRLIALFLVFFFFFNCEFSERNHIEGPKTCGGVEMLKIVPWHKTSERALMKNSRHRPIFFFFFNIKIGYKSNHPHV